jgi:hypothetical protein
VKHDTGYYLAEIRTELEDILRHAREGRVKTDQLAEWVEAAIKKLDKAEASLARSKGHAHE